MPQPIADNDDRGRQVRLGVLGTDCGVRGGQSGSVLSPSRPHGQANRVRSSEALQADSCRPGSGLRGCVAGRGHGSPDPSPLRLERAGAERHESNHLSSSLQLPLRSLGLSLVPPKGEPGSPKGDSVLGAVTHHVVLRKSRDWRAALGPPLNRRRPLSCGTSTWAVDGSRGSHVACIMLSSIVLDGYSQARR
jgi:hypothetical protein